MYLFRYKFSEKTKIYNPEVPTPSGFVIVMDFTDTLYSPLLHYRC